MSDRRCSPCCTLLDDAHTEDYNIIHPLSATVSRARTLKAEYLLGLRPQVNASVFDSTGGTLTWITAGRYAGYLSPPSMPHPDDHDVTGQSAFDELVATVRIWSGE